LKDLRGFGPIEHDFSKGAHGGRHLPAREQCRQIADPAGPLRRRSGRPLDMWETPPFSPVVKDGKMYGRGACDMKSGTIGALYALGCDQGRGPAGRRRDSLPVVIEEESTGVGALSTCSAATAPDACFIPEPTGGKMVRSQVGVIWFRLKVRGIPVHVAQAGSGSNAIMAAYHLITRCRSSKSSGTSAPRPIAFQDADASDQLQPGIIKGGDWALQRAGLVRRRLPDCGAAGLVDRRMPEGDFGLRVGGGARPQISLQQPAAGGMVGLPVGGL
jgi:acetylornithine deacetylase